MPTPGCGRGSPMDLALVCNAHTADRTRHYVYNARTKLYEWWWDEATYPGRVHVWGAVLRQVYARAVGDDWYRFRRQSDGRWVEDTFGFVWKVAIPPSEVDLSEMTEWDCLPDRAPGEILPSWQDLK